MKVVTIIELIGIALTRFIRVIGVSRKEVGKGGCTFIHVQYTFMYALYTLQLHESSAQVEPHTTTVCKLFFSLSFSLVHVTSSLYSPHLLTLLLFS